MTPNKKRAAELIEAFETLNRAKKVSSRASNLDGYYFSPALVRGDDSL